MASVGFFAYPESSAIIVDAVTGAVELSVSQDLRLRPWQKLRNIGFKLDMNEIRQIRGDGSRPAAHTPIRRSPR